MPRNNARKINARSNARTYARRRKRLRAGESRPGESRSAESRPAESRLDKSSECSREITKIFKERIDDTGYTWTKVSQPTKNFYFGEFKKHFVWDPKTETRVRKAWDAKASGCYADFFRDIRAKMVKPIFMSNSAWTKFTSHWGTSKYKEESIYKRPPTGFELFLHTHTSGHDKITFINEKSKTIHDNVLRLKQEREGNQVIAQSQVDETTLYIEAASGAKKRILKLSILEMKQLELPRLMTDCDSDSENTDGGDAHQGTNTSNSRAGMIAA
ncbi:PDR ABC-type transporter family protein [Tanacetum coccineum]